MFLVRGLGVTRKDKGGQGEGELGGTRKRNTAETKTIQEKWVALHTRWEGPEGFLAPEMLCSGYPQRELSGLFIIWTSTL